MRAITVQPRRANSATLAQIAEPAAAPGTVLVQMLALGVCGTDVEILRGDYGWPPPGRERLVLGHESLGHVLEAPSDCGLAVGDLVVGIVRRPDPVPCSSCAVGEWDMCRNGRYTEHGIKELDGFGCERVRLEPDRLVEVDPKLGDLGVLLEPASILAKAWEQIERIGHRAHWEPHRVLVTGAGPIGLLAALMARQRGFELDVLDLATDGPKPQLVGDLGGHYHTGKVEGLQPLPDITIECTGAPSVVLDVMRLNSPCGVVCLAGVSSGGRTLPLDVGGLNQSLVLENDVIFGTVNANRRHYEAAAKALVEADPSWLARLITRRVPLERWQEAVTKQPHDVKVVIDIQEADSRR